jgi:hypothetical protein
VKGKEDWQSGLLCGNGPTYFSKTQVNGWLENCFEPLIELRSNLWEQERAIDKFLSAESPSLN